MRYFFEISYRGSEYSGWQIQPNANSIQGEIQQSFSKLFKSKIDITGCGRTDSGVHARQFYFHVDLAELIDVEQIIFRLNKMLPAAISIHKIINVAENAHARFDANFRKYIYEMVGKKDPFSKDLTYHFPSFRLLDLDLLQSAGELILEYNTFYTFCKSNSDVKHYQCDIFESRWEISAEKHAISYHIAGNRFLRGMVRMIVGMCCNVAMNKLSLDEVKSALDKQNLLPKALSVPAHGLYLSEIRYPFLLV